MNENGWIVKFKGVVQGVGFRPLIYRLASAMGINGTVENSVSGVCLKMRCGTDEKERLIKLLKDSLPAIARIDDICSRRAEISSGIQGFHIVESNQSADRPTDVSPDIAICPECLDDIRRHPRRLDYPLTNCTNCGPRFSIIRQLPYDRVNTSMSHFELCPDCAKEYADPADRRFHAQPISCNHCGPKYTWHGTDGSSTQNYADMLKLATNVITGGGILMVKGLGGYNLLADATCQAANQRLRQLKCRPRKPFAVMAADIDMARSMAHVTPHEALTMQLWRAPIVIVRRRASSALAPAIAPGCSTTGIMLPYMAFHHHLCQAAGRPLTVTSSNRHSSPIITDDGIAMEYARCHGLPIVTYNRDIVNRLDDSVVRLIGSSPQILRRSRGYVPEALHGTSNVDGIVGMGADITSQWALGRGNDIIQSQYIGSMLNSADRESLKESIESLTRLFRVDKRLIVIDNHPAYASSAIGREMAANRIPTVGMWHHHAHAVSVMAEYGLTEPVLALVLDGTGLGPDRTIWGSELMLCTRTRFERIAHGPYFALPGGDKAATQPWRMAVSTVMTLFGSTQRLPEALTQSIGRANVDVISRMISRNINAPMSCGAGRIWDAVAALLGLALENGYESEAPILLENCANGLEADPYPISRDNPLDLKPLFDSILTDLDNRVDKSVISARFHNSYAEAWALSVIEASRKTGLKRLVLSGGVMQNALFTSLLTKKLLRHDIITYLPLKVPCNDAGIAVGQVAFGAEQSSV